jgi:hypothetical protein
MMQTGDRVLLCSDGLWGTVSDAEITQQLARNTISDSVPELVEQALRPSRWAMRFLPPPSKPACSAKSTPMNSTTPRLSALFARSMKPSGVRRRRKINVALQPQARDSIQAELFMALRH